MTENGPAEALRRLPLLAQLDEPARQAMVEAGFPRRAPRGTVIFNEGDPSQGLWALLEGRVKLVRISPQGKELLVHLVEAGQTFAEATLFGGRRYPATAVALEPCSLWLWPAERLRSLLAENPDLAIGLLASLAVWTRKILDKLDLMTQRRVEERLALFLLASHGGEQMEPGQEIRLALSKQIIAAQLGTGPEVLSRTLRQLEEAGIIENRSRSVIVLDPAALAALAAGGPLTAPRSPRR
jgi:CRP/FNR family transcriptional regulator